MVLMSFFTSMPKRAQEPARDRAVGTRAVDFERAPIHEIETSVEIEFVALRMAAEVVVVVEQQDAARAPALRALDRNARRRGRRCPRPPR